MIPEKYFYTIGDVSKLTGTKPHVLRYWESEFKLLRPARRYSGHRKYTKKDLELINRIRYLILEMKYTLAGAKREINRQYSPKAAAQQAEGTAAKTPAVSSAAMLTEIKKEVDACLDILQPAPLEQEMLQLEISK